MHRRKAVRDAVVAVLTASPEIAALVPAPAVESSRIIPDDPAALPRVLVYLRGEKAEGLISVSPRVYDIQLELVVEYVTRTKPASGPSEDELDQAAEAIEAAMDRLETTRFGGLVLGVVYQGTDVAVELKGAQATASLVMRYELEADRTVAAIAVDDFIRNPLEYAIGDAQADDPTDSIILPT